MAEWSMAVVLLATRGDHFVVVFNSLDELTGWRFRRENTPAGRRRSRAQSCGLYNTRRMNTCVRASVP
jgi:hypothetical protein